jgi:hypothetical protein
MYLVKNERFNRHFSRLLSIRGSYRKTTVLGIAGNNFNFKLGPSALPLPLDQPALELSLLNIQSQDT